LTGTDQHYWSCAPIQERRAEGGLKALQTPRHRGLRDIQVARRQAHRASVRNTHKCPDIIEFHVCILAMHTIHLQHDAARG
jgi:hypothetical protein